MTQPRKRCACCLGLFHTVKRRYVREKNKNMYICERCAPKVCISCLKCLDEGDVTILSDGCETHLCKECHIVEYVAAKMAEVERIQKELDFQKKYHLCQCGKLNDSRDNIGLVNRRSCSACRQVFADKSFVSRNAFGSEFRNKDHRVKYFHPVEGFKEK